MSKNVAIAPQIEAAVPVKHAARPAPETVRLECLKVAMERVTAAKPITTIIKEAEELEAWVLAGAKDE